MRIASYFFISCICVAVFAQEAKTDLISRVLKLENGKHLGNNSWLITLDNDTISFDKFKGKWVLVDYWSVTCRPCIKELPDMNEFAKNHGLPNLVVIAVSVDDQMDRWTKMSPKRALQFPSYFAGRSIENDLFGLNLSLADNGDQLQVMTTLPRYSLIDPKWKIVERELKLKPSDPDFSKYISSLMK